MGYFTKFRRSWIAAAGLALIATTQGALADPIATVLTVRGSAQGPQGNIVAGDRLDDGLVIRTNGATQMELEFDDGTLMAVGPNSELEISTVFMTSGGQASRFAITAATGSFRFLSGDSNREAYEITTPASTIGIRGTEFDIFVTPQTTGVALYRGALEMCLTNGAECWAFRGSCYLAEADKSRGRIIGIRIPEARSYLNNFIYARSQVGLSGELRTNINFCDKYFSGDDRDVPENIEEIVPIEEPEDPVEEPEDPQDTDEPEDLGDVDEPEDDLVIDDLAEN